MTICSSLKSVPLLLCCLFLSSAFAADRVSGTVQDRTTGKPAVGDEVVLLRLGEGMEEEVRAKTDAQGAFSFNLAAGQHLIQVSHQGVKYDQPLSAPGEIEISVFDVVPNIPGLSGTMGIAQLESDGKVLKITEMYAIRNNSNPPFTQSKPDNFEITIPPKAEFDSVEARRAEGLWLKVNPNPVKGKSGKFGLNFPIRPGDTLFKFTYHLPYEASATLHLRVPYPIEKFAVMHPPSMTFKPLRSGAFVSPNQLANNLKIEAAVAVPTTGDVPAFQISGVGQAPPHGTQTTNAPPAGSAPPPAATTPPAAASASAASPERSPLELWLLVAGIIAILALGGFVAWRMRKRGVTPAVTEKTPLDALKEELFQLESDRLRGAVSPEEYAATKQVLNQSIQRLLNKARTT